MKSAPVSKKDQNQRLDRFLVDQFQVSRKKGKQWIDQGRIFIGKKKVIIASWKVQEGDRVEVRERGDTGIPRRQRYLKVYFEDLDIIVVEKPTGVACESTPQTLTSTLVDDLNDYLKRAHPDRPFPYIGLMHRLDRETSGLMVYTLSKKANRLSRDFKVHKVERRYLALVEGRLPQAEGRISLPLKKDPKTGGKKMMTFKAGSGVKQGRALTDYRVKERYPGGTLVEARLLTGRTHQARVHFSSIGNPVFGDQLYGSSVQAPRQMLHSSYLEFQHPITGKKLKFRSAPPKDFQKTLEKIQKKGLRLQKKS